MSLHSLSVPSRGLLALLFAFLYHWTQAHSTQDSSPAAIRLPPRKAAIPTVIDGWSDASAYISQTVENKDEHGKSSSTGMADQANDRYALVNLKYEHNEDCRQEKRIENKRDRIECRDDGNELECKVDNGCLIWCDGCSGFEIGGVPFGKGAPVGPMEKQRKGVGVTQWDAEIQQRGDYDTVELPNIPQRELDALHALYISTDGENWVWRTDYELHGIPWDFDFIERSTHLAAESVPRRRKTPEDVQRLEREGSVESFLGASFSGTSSNGPLSEVSSTPNPCADNWQGVLCSECITDSDCHVKSLLLGEYGLAGTLPPEIGDLAQIVQFTLEANSISGTIPSEIGSLTKLENLYLAGNLLTGSIPASITQCTALENFYLGANRIHGSLPDDIGKLVNLQDIRLERNLISGSLPPSLFNIAGLLSVDFKDNELTGSIPVELGVAPSGLVTLNLIHNRLSGILPPNLVNLQSLSDGIFAENYFFGPLPAPSASSAGAEEGSQLPNALSLWFNTNMFSGTIPAGLGGLPLITQLQLQDNKLTGTIPKNFGSGGMLLNVQLNQNQLTGVLPRELCDLPKIEGLSVDDNMLSGTLPECIVEQLLNLGQVQVDGNYLSGSIPTSYLYPPNGSLLQVVYLSDNLFSGSLPAAPIYASPTALDGGVRGFLSAKSFENIGLVDDSTVSDGAKLHLDKPLNAGFASSASTYSSSSSLLNIYADSNILTSSIPASLIETHPMLQVLSLSQNSLTGSLSTPITNIPHLEVLNLAENFFQGDLNTTFATIGAVVRHFYVQQNMFTGLLPRMMTNERYHKLYAFDVSSNQLTGFLPDDLFRLQHLADLNCSNNNFVGNLTGGAREADQKTFNASHLISIDFSNNALTGSIPFTGFVTFLPAMRILILRNNRLSGQLIDSANKTLRLIEAVDVSNNRLTGPLPATLFGASSALQSFAAVGNCFSGTIPVDICDCRGLKSLALDGLSTAPQCRVPMLSPFLRRLIGGGVNTYELPLASVRGSIPRCLFELPSIQTLHLSGNALTGTLPENLTLGMSMSDLALSHNLLEGGIPTSIQQRTWTNLDLGFNRLSGMLDSSFPDGYVSSNTSLEVLVNRLSGAIPSSLRSAANIQMLVGNIFSCSASFLKEDSLPKNDPDAAEYECGSNFLDTAMYVWLCCMCSAVCAFCFSLYRVLRRRSAEKPQLEDQLNSSFASSSAFPRFAWLDITNEAYHHLYGDWSLVYSGWDASTYFGMNLQDIYYFGASIRHMQQLCCTFTLYAVSVLLPAFSVLSVFFGTYSEQYAWGLSSVYVSGVTAAATIFVLWVCAEVGISVLNVHLWSHRRNRDRLQDVKEEKGEKSGGEVDAEGSNYCRTGGGEIKDGNGSAEHDKLESSSVEPNIEDAGFARESIVEGTHSPLHPSDSAKTSRTRIANPGSGKCGSPIARATGSPNIERKKIDTWVSWLGLGAVLFTGIFCNIAAMMSANAAYVVVTINLRKDFVVLVGVGLACFKLLWNGVAIEYFTELFTRVYSNCNKEDNRADIDRVATEFRRSYPLGNPVLSATDRAHDAMCDVRIDQTMEESSVRDECTFAEFVVQLRIWLVVFNNVLAPCIAILFVSADCFFYVVQSPQEVVVSYTYEQCGGDLQYFVNFEPCDEVVTVTNTLTYPPPFSYSYQCSASLLTNYAPIYVYMSLFDGLLLPLFYITLHNMLQRYSVRADLSSEQTPAVVNGLNQNGESAAKSDGNRNERDHTVNSIHFVSSLIPPLLRADVRSAVVMQRLDKSVEYCPARRNETDANNGIIKTGRNVILGKNEPNVLEGDSLRRVSAVQASTGGERIFQEIINLTAKPRSTEAKTSNTRNSEVEMSITVSARSSASYFPSTGTNLEDESMMDIESGGQVVEDYSKERKSMLSPLQTPNSFHAPEAPLIFHKARFVSILVSNIAILGIYGAVFPPLAVAVCVQIMGTTMFSMYLVGRTVQPQKRQRNDETDRGCNVTDRQSDQQVGDHSCSSNYLRVSSNRFEIVSILSNQCAGVQESVHRALLPLAVLVSSAYGFFLFDVLGDAVGAERALWVLGVMPVIPILIWLCALLIGRTNR